MLETRDYPRFARRLLGFIFLFAFFAVISFALCFFFNDNGNDRLSDIFVVLAAVFSVIGLAGGFLKIHTVRCHVCGGKTKTVKNTDKDQWQAVCLKCGICWNLGLGTNTD